MKIEQQVVSLEEIIEQYCAPDTKLLLIGKYDHNLLKSALYQVAEYLQPKEE